MTIKSDASTLSTTFADVQKILDDVVESGPVGPPHGAFWRGISRDDFVSKKVLGCPIIHSENGTFVGTKSLLVLILKGSTPDCNQKQRPQMPFGFDPLTTLNIQTISDWIDAQCPP
jgi:hypothetical protein